MTTSYQRISALSIVATLVVMLVTGCSRRPGSVPAGIPLGLAKMRQVTIHDVTYDLFFDIPAVRTDSIKATVAISFEWKERPIDLAIDYLPPASTLKSISVNGEPSPIYYGDEHILISKAELTQKRNNITIEFMAGDGPLNRSDDFLYSLFVPSRASTCFPLFDQPDLKARFRLELLIPEGWRAMSNGKTLSETPENGKTRVKFNVTLPTSSYQFAFTAGRFKEIRDKASGMTMFYRETDSVKVARNAEQVFSLHRDALAWLEDYTGISYPYEKLDFALVPAFQFGGMEHPGSIFYRESSLFLEPSASVNEELRRASLIAHETAHMWFGNLVTMQWFDDVWMKEVFANFMAGKIVGPSFPSLNHELRFLLAHYPAAYDVDRTAGTHPIQQPLDNLRNAGSVYGAIIYQKAPIMMRNLENWMTEAAFKQGLREYLSKYAWRNATWDDLIACLKKFTKEDLDVWNRAWIKTGGMPEMQLTKAADGKTFLEIVNDTSRLIWPQSMLYRIRAKNIDIVQKVTVRNQPRAIVAKWEASEMEFIPNYKGQGYGYYQASVEYLLNEVRNETEPLARAGIWLTVWENFLHGAMPARQLLGNLLTATSTEKDPLLLEYLVDKLDRVYWQFLRSDERSLIASEVDNKILERLIIERDNSRKRALFNGLRSMATTPSAVETLRKLWADELTLGLDLSERDHIQLAYALALRNVPGSEEILAKQLDRISNPDRKAEMTFIMPALSADTSVRSAFMRRLIQKENRAREPWVLGAIHYIHHPLRAKESVKHLSASLWVVEELQRTGDIFFPKAWLDATLGDYQSREAAEAVRAYLYENKSLRPDLRNKVLQSADMLFRAEKMTSGTPEASR